MNIVQMQDSLKDLSDQQLLQTMQAGSAPHYLVLAEMQRRKKSRQESAQQQQQPQGTVADEIMSGIAAAPAPNMQRFSAGGVVPFNQGGSTRDQMLAELRRSLTVMAVPASQKAQIIRNAEMLPEAALPGYLSSVTSAGEAAPSAVSVMDTPAAPEGQTYSTPSEYGFLDYLGETLDPYASPKAVAEGVRATPKMLAEAPGATLDLVEPVYERSKPVFGATARSYEDIYGPGVGYFSELGRELANYPGKEVKYGPVAAAPPGTTYGEGDMPPIYDKYGADAAGEIPTVPQQKPEPDTGEGFRAGIEDLIDVDVPRVLDPYLTKAGSFLDERVGKPLEAWLDTRGKPKVYPPNPEMMAREAEAASAAPEQPVAPRGVSEILRVGRLDDSIPTAPTAPAQPKVGTEQLAGMGEAELAQTREVAKERPDFFSPEALMALGFGMIAGGSKPGSTFGSAVGEGGLAMLQQIQSQRKSEAERAETEMLERGRMERARMEQAGLTQRAGINADMYRDMQMGLNRAKAIEVRIADLSEKRTQYVSTMTEELRKQDPSLSKKEAMAKADAMHANLLNQLRQQYYDLAGLEAPMPGPYNVRTIPQP